MSLCHTIVQWGDVTEISVAETIRRLRAFEETSKGRRHEREGEQQLLFTRGEPLLTRAEWEAKVAEEQRSDEGSGNGVNINGDKKKYRDKFDKSKIDCRNCGEFGHFTEECDKQKKVTRAVAQLAIADADDEPTLL
ncbi:hypothetical protein E2562_012554 [Oryza meyeriana var. granulata]|uniref:CCHC-type domain-containing protein n=1 Tax=Oryza meyeriana var. granulata TaxID=110450 RepID=A0A6G1D311_9ORYZ|nr:hypothetical protein E2562_012554 [Oryza meyeriana var. granulata]